MKISKTLKNLSVFLLSFTLVLSIFLMLMLPSSAVNSNVQTIYNYLINDMKLTPAAACGMLANIEYESSFNPTLSGDSGNSYGICQWNSTRFDNLKSYCEKNGYDYTSLEGQLNFMSYELKNNPSDTGDILNKLVNIENTAQGAYDSGYAWCYYYARPSNKAAKADFRGTRAKLYYWPLYGKNTTTQSIGDINCDSSINSTDALMALQYAVNQTTLTDAQFNAADVNKDKAVNSTDALIILTISIGNDTISHYE